jgi:hypothetical protein
MPPHRSAAPPARYRILCYADASSHLALYRTSFTRQGGCTGEAVVLLRGVAVKLSLQAALCFQCGAGPEHMLLRTRRLKMTD